MVDINALKQAARIVKDENGEPVVQIPLDLWQQVVSSPIEAKPQEQPSQIEQILGVLKAWENIPDDKSDEWWDEFEQFLKENRVNFPERDLGLGDE